MYITRLNVEQMPRRRFEHSFVFDTIIYKCWQDENFMHIT